MRRCVAIPCAVLWLAAGAARPLPAQQVTIGIPQTTVSDGYWEYIGGRWSYFGPGFGFTGGGLSGPEFGGFDPNAGLTTGFAVGGNGTAGRLNLTAGTGRSTVMTSTTPMLTVTNGIPGSIFIGQQVPAVVGVVPVTGFNPGLNPALNPAFTNLGAANTVAGRYQRGEFHLRDGQVVPGRDPQLQLPPELAAPPELFAAPPEDHAPAVAEDPVAAAHAGPTGGRPLADPSEELWRKGQALEAAGKTGAARLLYQTALRTATGATRSQLEARLRELQ